MSLSPPHAPRVSSVCLSLSSVVSIPHPPTPPSPGSGLEAGMDFQDNTDSLGSRGCQFDWWDRMVSFLKEDKIFQSQHNNNKGL